MAADLAASWRPELARDGADGVIDRSQDARHSAGPNGGSTPRTCLELASRNPSWQRSCVTASTDRTYDRKRSDPHAASPLASRGPSTYGSRMGSLSRAVRDDNRNASIKTKCDSAISRLTALCASLQPRGRLLDQAEVGVLLDVDRAFEEAELALHLD